jgi:NAD+ synthase (glutamine-hydrolysing)
LVAVNGRIVAQGDQFSASDVQVVTATIDLNEVRAFRASIASRGVQASQQEHEYHRVQCDWKVSSDVAFAAVSRPIKVRIHVPEEEIAYGPACWLWDYLRRSGASGFFLPLSGGADSSSTLTITWMMCKIVCDAAAKGEQQVIDDVRRITQEPKDSAYIPSDPTELASRLIHTAYMGTSNSSETTLGFAKRLSDQVGNYHLAVNIDGVVEAILVLFEKTTGKRPQYKVHGGSYPENLALQNIQARFRMVFSYMLAQLLPWVRGQSGWLLVLGSANVDEGELPYAWFGLLVRLFVFFLIEV